MAKNFDCILCKEIENHSINVLKINRIILETENFVVLPTVGCFQIGYLLIVPKLHYLCFGEFNKQLFIELDGIINKISRYIKKTTGKDNIIFEHGTRDISKLTSTSIMHAHIHIMPFEGSFINFLPVDCKLKTIGGFADLAKENDNYLFLRDTNNVNYIVINNEYPSQFFRRIACKALGITECWDWRSHEFSENMKITLDFYKNIHEEE